MAEQANLSDLLGGGAGQTVGLGDLNTTFKVGNQNMSQLIQAVQALAAIFPRVTSITVGTFTCAAAATTTVTETLVAANSFIVPFPTNAAAATLMAGATSLYLSARTADTSFAVTTANAAAAAGTETFVYLLVTP